MLHSTDRLLIASWCVLSLVSLTLHARIPAWRALVAANIAAVIVTVLLAGAAHITNSKVIRWAHEWAALPMVVFTYKQIYFIAGPIYHGKDFDQLLIAVDRALFRVNPTQWLAAFSNPFLTEALQIAYSLFYVFFAAVGLELYLKQDLFQFRYFRFTAVHGFLISYIGYLFLPAVGPRFTLHDFSRTGAELPGLLLTHFLQWFVNFWESIPSGASNAAALARAQRDVFPSGHTMMTLIAAILAYRYRLRIRHYVGVLGAMLIFATVYLRYHYVVDVLAGALLVIPCLLTTGKVRALFGSEDPSIS